MYPRTMMVTWILSSVKDRIAMLQMKKKKLITQGRGLLTCQPPSDGRRSSRNMVAGTRHGSRDTSRENMHMISASFHDYDMHTPTARANAWQILGPLRFSIPLRWRCAAREHTR
jgi:hypothetical protein